MCSSVDQSYLLIFVVENVAFITLGEPITGIYFSLNQTTTVLAALHVQTSKQVS